MITLCTRTKEAVRSQQDSSSRQLQQEGLLGMQANEIERVHARKVCTKERVGPDRAGWVHGRRPWPACVCAQVSAQAGQRSSSSPLYWTVCGRPWEQ